MSWVLFGFLLLTHGFVQGMKPGELSVDLVRAVADLHQVLGLDDLINLAATAAASVDFFLPLLTIRARLAHYHLAKQVNEGFLASIEQTEKRNMMASLALYKLLEV